MRKYLIILLLLATPVFAADQILSAVQNSDGSAVFQYQFDNGAGLTFKQPIFVPAPKSGSYTIQQAQSASIPLAVSAKARWISSLQNQSILGPVTLPTN